MRTAFCSQGMNYPVTFSPASNAVNLGPDGGFIELPIHPHIWELQSLPPTKLEHEMKTKKIDVPATRRLANRIADMLLANGAGDKGKRLVIELPDGRDGGGWCRDAIIGQVLHAVADENK